MNGEEGSRQSARALRNIARVDYKSLHRGKSQKCKIMSSIEEEPKSDALICDMSSLDTGCFCMLSKFGPESWAL